MKFTCTQENLNQGLLVTGRLTSKNVNLPILNNVLIEAKEGNLKFSSTNLEIGISCLVRGKVEKEGTFTVESKLLTDYVNLLPKENVDLELIKDDYLSVKCKNSQTRVKGINADDFPVIPKIDKKDGYKVSINDFKQALSQVIFAVSTSETRPEINGVFMVFNDEAGKLTMVGTDSYRLAEKKIALTGHAAKREVIVPVKVLQEVMRILGVLKSPENENLEIYLSDNQISFSIDTIEVISRLAEGQYPDYKQIIPTEKKTEVKADTNELVKIIKTTSLFSKTGINDISLEFLAEKKSLVISSTNIQVGESFSELEVEYTGDNNATTLNFKFLLEGLNNINAGEVEISLIDNNIPCMIRPKDDKSYLYIVMPIRQ
jgi:DNA polymerase III subunit beta